MSVLDDQSREQLRRQGATLAGIVGKKAKDASVVSATVSRIDDDGTVWVSIGDAEAPAAPGMRASVGDKVSVRLSDGTATITDNRTRPATDDATALTAQETALGAQGVAVDAKKAAEMAAEVAGAIGQHFWTDEAGVHVSNEEGKADGSRNSIFNSLGLIFREGANYLMGLVSGSAVGAAESDRGMAIFDGLGNAAANVIAWFGRNGIRIGRQSEQHVEITAQGISITNGSTAGTVNGVDVVATNTTANAASSTANSAATAASNAQSTADAALRMAADSADNMLTDWNAPSLAKADGPAARYFSDNSANRTVEYIQVSDPPEPGIAYGARVTSQGAQANNTTKSAVCFYASNTNVAMSEGQSYTVSFWARCTSGACAYYCQVGSSPYAQKNGSNTYSDENALGAQWQRIEWTFQYTAAGMGGGGGGCRIYCGIVFKASTAGVGEVCGFRLVPGVSGGTAADAAAEAQALAATADGKASKTQENFWADSGGVHVSTQANMAAGTYNSLFASTGLLFRNQSNNLVSLTKSALNFYDGSGNADANVTASYGANSVRIGKLADYHYYGTATSLGLYPGGNNTANDALVYADSTPSVRIGKKNSRHLFLSGNVLSFSQSGYNDDSAIGTYSSFIVDGSIPAVTFGNRRSQKAVGSYSSVFGNTCEASGDYSHAEGVSTSASGQSSHAEGSGTSASGAKSHAEGEGSTASGFSSHSEGSGTIASGQYSHAEGQRTVAEGNYSHACGYESKSSGGYSFASGFTTEAIGTASSTFGFATRASTLYGMAIGVLNDYSEGGLFVVGNGTISNNKRRNAFVVTSNEVKSKVDLYAEGNLYVSGNIEADKRIDLGDRSVSGIDYHARLETSSTGTLHLIPSSGGYSSSNTARGDFALISDGRLGVRRHDGSAWGAWSYYQFGNAGRIEASGPFTMNTSLSLGTAANAHPLEVFDSSGVIIAQNRVGVTADNKSYNYLVARQGRSDAGGIKQVSFGILCDSSGTATYRVQNPENFRSAIGLEDPSTAVTAIASVITAGTGVTIKSVRYQTFGKVATVSISFTKSTASAEGNSFVVGTIVSGKRPATEANCGSNAYCGYINTSGQVLVRNIMGAQIAANTELHVNATYILP